MQPKGKHNPAEGKTFQPAASPAGDCRYCAMLMPRYRKGRKIMHDVAVTSITDREIECRAPDVLADEKLAAYKRSQGVVPKE
jgi:hypothetical protein